MANQTINEDTVISLERPSEFMRNLGVGGMNQDLIEPLPGDYIQMFDPETK